jgi:predicted TIM-barrel fold metal-dependent hydrolase
MTPSNIPLIVSADDHVAEPRGVWTSRLPVRYRDVGPRVEYLPEGTRTVDPGTTRAIDKPGTSGRIVAYWHYEDHYSLMKANLHSGGDPDLIKPHGITFEEIRPGCYDPKARLVDMDMNHTEASMCFPNFPRFAGQAFLEAADRRLALLCVRAYNDWMVEEWCAEGDGRLIPLCLVPLWDSEFAASEVRRNAARGVRAVNFSELPPWLGLPSIHSGYWDPFFRACDETNTVICMHIGSGTKTLKTSEDAPFAVHSIAIFANTAASMIDYLASSVLVRFSHIKLMYAESQIGWIPYVLERADDLFSQQPWLFSDSLAKPSELYRDRVYSSFFRDETGIDNLERIGASQVLFEVDYPHGDTTFPRSREAASRQFGHLDPETVQSIARGNAISLFGLKHLTQAGVS